jgi:hypothetical protein
MVKAQSCCFSGVAPPWGLQIQNEEDTGSGLIACEN